MLVCEYIGDFFADACDYKCAQRLNTLPICDCIIIYTNICYIGLHQWIKLILQINLHIFITKDQLSIYLLDCKKFLMTQEINVLLDSDLNKKPVCSQFPLLLPLMLFIVNLKLQWILCDDMGSWKWSGSFRRWCFVSSGFVKLLGKDEPENGLPCDAYHIWKQYYSLQTSPDLKMVVTL